MGQGWDSGLVVVTAHVWSSGPGSRAHGALTTRKSPPWLVGGPPLCWFSMSWALATGNLRARGCGWEEEGSPRALVAALARTGITTVPLLGSRTFFFFIQPGCLFPRGSCSPAPTAAPGKQSQMTQRDWQSSGSERAGVALGGGGGRQDRGPSILLPLRPCGRQPGGLLWLRLVTVWAVSYGSALGPGPAGGGHTQSDLGQLSGRPACRGPLELSRPFHASLLLKPLLEENTGTAGRKLFPPPSTVPLDCLGFGGPGGGCRRKTFVLHAFDSSS